MKKIIDKKLYDTETSELIHEYSNGYGRSDFNCIELTLYVTESGKYFLQYFGGAATSYAESYGNYTSEGSGIIPLTIEETYNWLEDIGATEVLIERFPDLITPA